MAYIDKVSMGCLEATLSNSVFKSGVSNPAMFNGGKTFSWCQCYKTFKPSSSFTTWGLYYKKIQIRNLQKMDRFPSKIVPFLLSVTLTGVDKHTSLDQTH